MSEASHFRFKAYFSLRVKLFFCLSKRKVTKEKDTSQGRRRKKHPVSVRRRSRHP